MAQSQTIGIDLGDCFFRLSYLHGATPKIISDANGRTGFPSKVSFLPGGRCRAGFDAEMFGIPEDTILHPMTLVGKSAAELLALNGRYAYEIIQERNRILINANRVFISIDEVLIALFAHIKELAEQSLKAKVESAVIAIPDGLGDTSRLKIKRAAVEAGLEVKQLLNQNTAATLGLSFDAGNLTRTIAIVDVGASHTSISTLQAGQRRLETISVSHFPIGVNDFQQALAQKITALARNRRLLSVQNDFSKNEIMIEAGFALVELSAKKTVEVSIGGIGPGGTRAIFDISRSEFEAAINPILSGINFGSLRGVDQLIAIGGGANIPVVRQLISNRFQKALFHLQNLDPTTIVALGAAKKAGIIQGVINSRSVEKTVHDLGTWYNGHYMDVLVPRGTELPFATEKIYNQAAGPYRERVLQYLGNDSGQDKSESHPNVVVLADKRMVLHGNRVKITIVIDASGITEFKVTDLPSGEETILTGFSIG